MGSNLDRAAAGGRIAARIGVSALWGGAAVIAFSAGSIIVGLACVAYVVYLLAFGGRLLIY